MPTQSLDQVRMHLQAGRLAEAETGCRAILAVQANDAEALHLLGVVLFKTGRANEGAEKLRRSIELSPQRADYLCNLGVMLAETRPAEAADLFRKALKIQPSDVQTAVNL